MAEQQLQSSAENSEHRSSLETGTGIAPGVVRALEWLDDAARVLVAIFLLLLALAVLVYAVALFEREQTHFVDALRYASGDNAADLLFVQNFIGVLVLLLGVLTLVGTTVWIKRTYTDNYALCDSLTEYGIMKLYKIRTKGYRT